MRDAKTKGTEESAIVSQSEDELDYEVDDITITECSDTESRSCDDIATASTQR